MAEAKQTQVECGLLNQTTTHSGGVAAPGSGGHLHTAKRCESVQVAVFGESGPLCVFTCGSQAGARKRRRHDQRRAD